MPETYFQKFSEFQASNPIAAEQWVTKIVAELQESSSKVSQAESIDISAVWGKDVRTIFKKIIFEVFNYLDIHDLLNQVDIILTGSLAKDLATPYSDIDAICLIKTNNAEEIAKIKEAMEFIYYFMDAVNQQCNMLCPDPVGINIHKFCLTYDELQNNFHHGTLGVDTDSLCKSFLKGSRVFHGSDTQQFLQLQRFFATQYTGKQDSNEIKQEIIKKFYRDAVEEFSGPRAGQKINIKRDLLRPLDALLAAIRYEFGYMAEDSEDLLTGDYLSISALITDMQQREAMSPFVANLIHKIARKAIKLRLEYHTKAKEEQDNVEITKDNKKEIQELLDGMALLRGLAKVRLEALNSAQDSGNKFDTFPYAQNPPFCDSDAGCSITQDHQALKKQIEHYTQWEPDQSSAMAQYIRCKGVNDFKIAKLKKWGQAIGRDQYLKLSNILPQKLPEKDARGSKKYFEYDYKQRKKQRVLLLSIVYHRIKTAKTYKEVTSILDELSDPKYDWVFARRKKDMVGTFFGYHWGHKAKSYAWMQVVKMAKNRILDLAQEEVAQETKVKVIFQTEKGAELTVNYRDLRALNVSGVGDYKLKIDSAPGQEAKAILAKNRDRRGCVTKSLMIHSLLTSTSSKRFRKMGGSMLKKEQQATEKWFEKEIKLST